MSLYNAIYGMNQSVFLILPMLGKHPDEYPRFRDCFIGDDEHPEYANHIIIYTRTGGGNRESYIKENQAIREIEGFVGDYDDSFDSTFACWVFKVPAKWEKDFPLLINKKFKEVSAEYRAEMKRVFPTLASVFEKLFTE